MNEKANGLLDFLQKNTFQVALITDGSKSFVSFHYGDMTWASGALSDNPAVVEHLRIFKSI